MSFGPFVMVLGVLESRGVGATFDLEIMKKYFLTKKWEHKTFCVIFFITNFKIKKNKKICKFSKIRKIFNFEKIFSRKTMFI